jgi:hypothetical protein
LFTFNFVGCRRCGQKYNILLPPNLKETILNNIETLSKTNRVVIYGLNYHAVKLFKNVEVSDNVWFIEDTDIKQNMFISGKHVFKSDIISSQNIDIVVICVPMYYNQIKDKIQRDNSSTKIISVLDLLTPDVKLCL